MAFLLRSISFKIFGISLGLLLMMLVTTIWSASASERVHRQLQTLVQVMFPLASTMAGLELVVNQQKVTADFLLETPDAEAAATCLREARVQGEKTRRLLDRARQLNRLGETMAQTEQNRLAMARFAPMLDELAYQERRLSRMTFAACAREAEAGIMQAAKSQSDEVLRLTGKIVAEIDQFVEEAARRVGENQQNAIRANMVMMATAGLVGIMLAWLVSRGMTRPIVRLQAGAREASAGRLEEAHVPVTTHDEIGEVTQAFNAMLLDLREKERIKETFGQYVDPRIVAGLLDDGRQATSGDKQLATLFFSDMVNFSAIAERLAPATLVELVNAYFAEMSQPIRTHSGIIDKYIGDAIMAFWVPPFTDPTRQAELACRAALEQHDLLAAFRTRVPDVIGLRKDVPVIDFRIGIVTGEVIVGSVGSQTARSFTVMGDSVNQASRLEAANKVYGTRILIDHATRCAAGDAIEVRELDQIRTAGSSEPIRIYELASLQGGLAATRREAFDIYEDGLSLYRQGHWDKAATAFAAVLQAAPDDGPARTMLSRLKASQSADRADWDGIWQLTAK